MTRATSALISAVAERRLRRQRLVGERFATAVDVVRALGAVQSQDYAGAKWGVGLRTRGATDAELDRLFDEGAILRTHVMRPTWHFVLPEDARWLLELTGPRVKARTAPYARRQGIDDDLVRRSQAAMEDALRDGAHLTRAELGAALERRGIVAVRERLGILTATAELDGLVISGARKGKQQTYALLALRAPGARSLDRDEALAELATRYFTGHGPAQVQDCAWWSGLTIGDCRRGIELAGAALAREDIAGRPHWSAPGDAEARPRPRREPAVHLLPNYDELLVAYRDRSAAMDPARDPDTTPFPYGSILAHVVTVDGQVRGGWKRVTRGRQVVVDLGPLDALDETGTAGLRAAGAELERFLGVPVTLEGLAEG